MDTENADHWAKRMTLHCGVRPRLQLACHGLQADKLARGILFYGQKVSQQSSATDRENVVMQSNALVTVARSPKR